MRNKLRHSAIFTFAPCFPVNIYASLSTVAPDDNVELLIRVASIVMLKLKIKLLKIRDYNFKQRKLQ